MKYITCIQARLNHISFNQTHPIIIVGDSRGYIQVFQFTHDDNDADAAADDDDANANADDD